MMAETKAETLVAQMDDSLVDMKVEKTAVSMEGELAEMKVWMLADKMAVWTV